MKTFKLVISSFLLLIIFGCNSLSANKNTEQQTINYEAIYEKEDREILEKKLTWAKENNLNNLPANKIIIEVAKSFLKTPYEAYTLEIEYPEKLVINMRGLDCLTFLENVLVISQMIKQEKYSFNNFENLLKDIRYRQSCSVSYSCRLHYYTDWLLEAEQKGILKNIFGPDQFQKEINLLSQHTKRKDEIPKLKNIEKKLSEKQINYFSCKTLEKTNLNNLLQDGDIIGFTSNIDGLDVNHVAFAYKENNRWTYIDATSVKSKNVEIYPGDIVEYCNRVKTNTGIVLARPTI